MIRKLTLAALTAVAFAAGCTDDLSQPPTPFGDFALGYDVVVATNAQPVGPSRQATPDEWKSVLVEEVDKRMRRYKGNKLYHLGIGVKAYALAVPGIPLVLSPKSVLVIDVDVWDDTAKRTINAETKEFTVFEGMSGETMVGSGLTQSKEQQMHRLAANAAKKINEWLIANKAWFTPEAVAARAALPPPPADPAPAPAKAAAAN